jgi:hypothetical protein
MKQRVCGLMASALFTVSPVWGQVTPADYARSEGLRDAWMYLTENVADPGTWVGDTSQFVYRKTIPGGFSFVVMDARTRERRPAFDQARLATALSKISGATYTALRLPFTSVVFTRDGSAITFSFSEMLWTCTVSDYVCAKRPCG